MAGVGIKPDFAQHLFDHGGPFGPVFAEAMDHQTFLYDPCHRHPRTERRERILEHHLQFPAHRPKGFAAEVRTNAWATLPRPEPGLGQSAERRITSIEGKPVRRYNVTKKRPLNAVAALIT